MAIRYIDEPVKSRIRYLDEPQQAPALPSKPLIQRGFEAVKETPQRMAGLLPVIGGVGGDILGRQLGGRLGGVLGSALGTGGGVLAQQKMQRAPEQTTGELLSPVARGLGLMPPIGKYTTPAVPTKEELRNTRDPAIFAGLLSAGAETAGALAKPLSGKIINSMIGPGKVSFKYGKNPGRTVSELGITGNSLEELETNIGRSLQEHTNKLQQILSAPQNAGKRIDFSGALGVIDDTLAKLGKMSKSNAPVIQRVQKLRSDLLSLTRGPRGSFRSTITSLTPEQAVEMKRATGDAAGWTGGDVPKAFEGMVHKSYHEMRKAIELAVPESIKINDNIAGLIGAQRAMPGAIARSEKWILPFASRSVFSGATPYMLGGGPLGAAMGVGANALLSHPMTGTRIASSLAKFGKLMAKGK